VRIRSITAASTLKCLAVIGSAAHRRVQAETLLVGTQRLGERGVSRHGGLHREHLLAGTRAEGDAVSAGRGLQRPERTCVVRVAVAVGVAVGQVRRPLLVDAHTAPGHLLQQPADDLVQQRLQRFIRGCG